MNQYDFLENPEGEVSSRVRTNALSAYFFLGFLYLLAYRNPNFSHPFVRAHAWAATKLHIILLGFVVVYRSLLAPLLVYTIPVLEIPVSRVMFSLIFLGILGYIFRGAYLAHSGKHPREAIFFPSTDSEVDLTGIRISGEADLARALLSFMPFIGLFVAERHDTPLTQIGSKVSWYGSFLLVLESAFFRADDLVVVTLFFIILLIVTIGVYLISGKSVTFLSPVSRLPWIESIHAFLASIPAYCMDVARVIVGRKNELDFIALYKEKLRSAAAAESELAKFFDDSSTAVSPYLIYIPGINLLFAHRFFFPGKSRYVLAVNQGIVLTFLCIALYFFTESSTLLVVAFLPMMLGIAMISHRPFFRIPVLYEVGALLSSLTFGIISGTKQAREKSQEVREVRFVVK